MSTMPNVMHSRGFCIIMTSVISNVYEKYVFKFFKYLLLLKYSGCLMFHMTKSENLSVICRYWEITLRQIYLWKTWISFRTKRGFCYSATFSTNLHFNTVDLSLNEVFLH